MSITPDRQPGSVSTGKRVMRVFIVTLSFVCIAPFVQVALVIVVVPPILHSSDPGQFQVGKFLGFALILLMPAAVFAGLTGLLAGIYEALFGRINARVVFAISAVIALVPFILTEAIDPRFGGEAAGYLLCFVAGTVVCWKVIERMRGKEAAQGLPPP